MKGGSQESRSPHGRINKEGSSIKPPPVFCFTCLPPPTGISLRHGAIDLVDAEGLANGLVIAFRG